MFCACSCTTLSPLSTCWCLPDKRAGSSNMFILGLHSMTPHFLVHCLIHLCLLAAFAWRSEILSVVTTGCTVT